MRPFSETVHETTWPSKDPVEKPMYIPAGTMQVFFLLWTVIKSLIQHPVQPTLYLSCTAEKICGAQMVRYSVARFNPYDCHQLSNSIQIASWMTACRNISFLTLSYSFLSMLVLASVWDNKSALFSYLTVLSADMVYSLHIMKCHSCSSASSKVSQQSVSTLMRNHRTLECPPRGRRFLAGKASKNSGPRHIWPCMLTHAIRFLMFCWIWVLILCLGRDVGKDDGSR